MSSAVGSYSIIIGIILLAVSVMYWKVLDARLTAFEVRETDRSLKLESAVSAIRDIWGSVADIREKLKSINIRIDESKDQQAVEFIAQEIIRLDREVAKLRPVIRIVMPKPETKKKVK